MKYLIVSAVPFDVIIQAIGIPIQDCMLYEYFESNFFGVRRNTLWLHLLHTINVNKVIFLYMVVLWVPSMKRMVEPWVWYCSSCHRACIIKVKVLSQRSEPGGTGQAPDLNPRRLSAVQILSTHLNIEVPLSLSRWIVSDSIAFSMWLISAKTTKLFWCGGAWLGL